MKKLRCLDDIVRRFDLGHLSEKTGHFTEVSCLECGLEFGVHSLVAIKQELLNHTCVLQSIESVKDMSK